MFDCQSFVSQTFTKICDFHEIMSKFEVALKPKGAVYLFTTLKKFCWDEWGGGFTFFLHTRGNNSFDVFEKK